MRITQAMLPSLNVLQGFGLNRHVRGWNRLLTMLFPHDRQPVGHVLTRQWGVCYKVLNPKPCTIFTRRSCEVVR